MLEELEIKKLGSTVVAEAMKLLGNSSYGKQIMDRSGHTETKYVNDENTHKSINGKLFKRLNNVLERLYKTEFVKSKIGHRDPTIVVFFVLQYAKLRILVLYYNFFDKFCDVDTFEDLEKSTDSVYLALAHDNLYNCIRPSKKAEWEDLREHDCDDSFKADAVQKFFPRICCDKHKKREKREPGLFTEEIRCSETFCLCSKTYCCYDDKSDTYQFSSRGLNKRTLEETGDGQ